MAPSLNCADGVGGRRLPGRAGARLGPGPCPRPSKDAMALMPAWCSNRAPPSRLQLAWDAPARPAVTDAKVAAG